MPNLETTFAGLKLKNPIIVGSSGLTNSVDKIREIAQKGAAAVVLKSLFEEQIIHDVNSTIKHSAHSGADDYIAEYIKSNSINTYLNLIKETKAKTDIPIIASINCQNSAKWVSFAKEIENAGADALEVNVYFLPIDKNKPSSEYEQTYFDLLKSLKENTKIPLIFKLGNNFTNLTYLANRLNANGISAITIFNRFYEPDIDVNNLKLTAAEIFSYPSESRKVIRWLALLTDKVKGLEISASTGVHDRETAIKYLLAGATTVQLCSVIYKNGISIISEIIDGISKWMESKKIDKISDFRGMMSYKQISDPTIYERAQFIKHFSNFE